MIFEAQLQGFKIMIGTKFNQTSRYWELAFGTQN